VKRIIDNNPKLFYLAFEKYKGYGFEKIGACRKAVKKAKDIK
jgi:hypothetical protein